MTGATVTKPGRPAAKRLISGIGAAVHTTGYALWLGGIVAIGGLVAPGAFHFTESIPQLAGNVDLQKAIAGGIVGVSLKGFNALSYGAGIAMLFSDGLESFGTGTVRFGAATFGRSIVTVGLLLIAAYLGMHVTPIMDRPSVHGTTLFEQLHQQYVSLVGVQVILLLVIPVITAWRNECLRP